MFRDRFIRALQCNTYAHARTVRLFFHPLLKEWLLHLMRVVIHHLIIKFLPVELATLQRPNFRVFVHKKRKCMYLTMYLLILIDWYGTLSRPAASSCSCSGKSSLHCMYVYMYIRIMLAEKRDIKRQDARQGIPRRGACKACKARARVPLVYTNLQFINRFKPCPAMCFYDRFHKSFVYST